MLAVVFFVIALYVVKSNGEKCSYGEYYNTTSKVCNQCPCSHWKYAASHSDTSCDTAPPTQVDEFYGYHFFIDGKDRNMLGLLQYGWYYKGTVNNGFKIGCAAGCYDKDGHHCETCPLGQYQDAPSGHIEVGCKLCPSGKKVAARDMLTDAGPTKCEWLVCAAGKYVTGNVCSNCAVGQYRSSTVAQTSCATCDAGSYQDEAGKAVCKDCPHGKYHITGTNHCENCVVGQHQDVVAKTSCKECLPGSYQSLAGQAYCETCPAGRWIGVSGAKEECTLCAAGMYSYPGSMSEASCLSCPRGKYGTPTRASCLTCTEGKFRDAVQGVGENACTNCPASKPKTGGTPHASSCILCDPNYYSQTLNRDDCEICPACAAGSQRQNCMDDSPGECIACPAGRIKAAAGTTPCSKCPDGTMPTNAATACEQCPPGKVGVGGKCDISCVGASTMRSADKKACLQLSGAYSPDATNENKLNKNLTVVFLAKYLQDRLASARIDARLCPDSAGTGTQCVDNGADKSIGHLEGYRRSTLLECATLSGIGTTLSLGPKPLSEIRQLVVKMMVDDGRLESYDLAAGVSDEGIQDLCGLRMEASIFVPRIGEHCIRVAEKYRIHVSLSNATNTGRIWTSTDAFNIAPNIAPSFAGNVPVLMPSTIDAVTTFFSCKVTPATDVDSPATEVRGYASSFLVAYSGVETTIENNDNHITYIKDSNRYSSILTKSAPISLKPGRDNIRCDVIPFDGCVHGNPALSLERPVKLLRLMTSLESKLLSNSHWLVGYHAPHTTANGGIGDWELEADQIVYSRFLSVHSYGYNFVYGENAYFLTLSKDSELEHRIILNCSVAYLLYPFVCKNCFKLLACRTGFVDGHADAYMMWDLREACFEGNHLLMLLAIGIPSLMLYLIGFPFLGYYVLEKQQGKFGNDQALFRYGMFISGYREGFYHWESVVASRKAVFIGSSIFLSTYGPSIQTYVVLLLLLFFLFLHIYTGAYSTKTLNRLESVSLVVSYLTLYLGLGFFMGTLSENTEIYMTILIYFMNISFCLGCSGVLVKEVVFMEEHILQLWWKKCFGPKKVEDAATSRNDEGVQKIPNTKVAPTITNSPAREVGNGVQVISKEKHQFALAHIRKNYGAGSPEYNLVLLLIQRINSAKTDEELSEANNALSNFMNTKKNKHSKTREGAKQN